MKIAVYGVGAVGGYFGGRLAAAGAEVHLLARGLHLDALHRNGLTVKSPKGDLSLRLPATADPRDIGPCDLVLLTVKAFDVEAAAATLPPLLHADAAVLSLQNGIESEEHIAGVIGAEHVLGGAAFIFARIAEPGVIEHISGPGKIVFGELDGRSSARTQRFLELCRAAGIEAVLTDNVRQALWSKFAFICAQAGMTAGARLPIGRIRSVPETWEMFRRLLEEACALAAAEGVPLPADTVERHLQFAQALSPDSYSSLYDDITRGRQTELEWLHGTVVRRARGQGLAVPMHEAVYAILKAATGSSAASA